MKNNSLTALVRVVLALALAQTANAVEPPTDLVAAVEFDAITISWTPDPAGDGVNIYAGGNYIDTVVAGSNSYPATMLPTGIEICFELVAYEFVGGLPEFSNFSELVCGTPGDMAPTEQCSPIVTAIGIPEDVSAFAENGQAGINWAEVPGATGYNIFINGAYETTVKGATTAVVTHLPGQEYSVAAFNDLLVPQLYGEQSEPVLAITVSEVVVLP